MVIITHLNRKKVYRLKVRFKKYLTEDKRLLVKYSSHFNTNKGLLSIHRDIQTRKK